MMLELAPEQSQRAHDRWAGHVDDCAVTLAPVEIKDVLKLVEERRAGFALKDALQHRREHHRLHAARRALAARLTGEELRELKRHFDHAGCIGVKAHYAATQTRAGLPERFGIEPNIKAIGREEGARRP